MNGVTLDTGALLAVERGSTRMTALLQQITERGASISVPVGVVAQAWREGARQARLARLLSAAETDIVPLTAATARAVGAVCGHTGVDDVVDVSVVLCARERGDTIVTSDPADLRDIDGKASLVALSALSPPAVRRIEEWTTS